jgi:type II secretory pathway component GspD/PulD (secretin)
MQDARTFQKGQAEQMAKEQAENMPSIITVEIPDDAYVVKSAYDELPEELNKDVNVSFKNTGVKKLAEYLSRALEINFVSDIGVQGDTKIAKGIVINYSGKLREFLSILSDASGHLIFYKNGSIILKDSEVFSVVVPQYPELLKEVEKNLEKMGGTGISYDGLTSSLTFRADYGGVKRIKDYLNKLKDNAALVTMKIIIANVKLTGEKNLGIDWTKFIYGYGTLKTSFQPQASTTTGGTTTESATRIFKEGASVIFSQAGSSVLIDAKTFTISSLFNFLESYGKFKVVQNIFIETLSGKTGKIDVSTETPYIKNVAISPVVGATTGATTTTLAQAQSDVAKTGVVLEITPHYNAKAKTLGVNLDAGVYGVTRFINLSAGQLGILTQPEVTKKQVKTYLRMTADQVAVVGGLTYDKDADNIAGLPGDTYLTKTKQTVTEREELVIVVKPTVVEFVNKGDKGDHR